MSEERPESSMEDTTGSGSQPVPASSAPSLVVCSLEPWTEVRRRLQVLTDEMLAGDPSLHVLYVAPPVDPLHVVRRSPRDVAATLRVPRVQNVGPRLRVLVPRKWAPRAIGPFAQRSLERQVLGAVRDWGLERPVLWINDAGYAPLLGRTGWSAVYDVTDDWLLAPMPSRQRARLERDDRLLLDRAAAVVVCSPELARTRGADRPVELIPNAVDVDRFRAPQVRPSELPASPVAVYVGTLHDERVDVDLVERLATDRPDVQVALVGPDVLTAASSARLRSRDNVHLVGPVPYEQVPGFLQHADVVVVPHRVNAFTESLDPIKAYECMAAGRPTVATPVAGFRDLRPPIRVAEAAEFVAAVSAALSEGPAPGAPGTPTPAVPTWGDRAQAAAALLDRVRAGSDDAPAASGGTTTDGRTGRAGTVVRESPTVPFAAGHRPYPESAGAPITKGSVR